MSALSLVWGVAANGHRFDVSDERSTSLPQTSCKANRVAIYRYLTDLFKALPYATTADDYEAVLPWKLGTPAREKNG